MNGRIVSAAAIAALLMLSSCGGEDGPTGGSPTPSPTATATPTPTPSPTPTFSYSSFADLTGDREFGVACLTYAPFTNGVPTFTGSQWQVSNMGISYDSASDSWTIARASGAQQTTFGPAELVSSANGNLAYATTSAPPQTLGITVPQAGGLSAIYARSLSFFITPVVDVRELGTCSIGVPTDPADLPAGIAVFDRLSLTGTVIAENPAGGDPIISEVIGGSGTISADMDQRKITFNLFYTVRDSGGFETTLGPIQGTIDIEEQPNAVGYFEQIGIGPPIWQVNGTFYGPSAMETGFSLHGAFDIDENSLNESYLIVSGYAWR